MFPGLEQEEQCPSSPFNMTKSLSKMRRNHTHTQKKKPSSSLPATLNSTPGLLLPPSPPLLPPLPPPPRYWFPNPALSPQVPLTSPKPCFIFFLFLPRCYTLSLNIFLSSSPSLNLLSHHPFPGSCIPHSLLISIFPSLLDHAAPQIFSTPDSLCHPYSGFYLCPQDFSPER